MLGGGFSVGCGRDAHTPSRLRSAVISTLYLLPSTLIQTIQTIQTLQTFNLEPMNVLFLIELVVGGGEEVGEGIVALAA